MPATTGDILNYRRKQGGWSCADVARVSSFLSAEDVASIEAQRMPAARDVSEYLRALEALQGRDSLSAWQAAMIGVGGRRARRS